MDGRAENTPTARKNSEYSSAKVGHSGRPRYKNELTDVKLVADGGRWSCFLIMSLCTCTYILIVRREHEGRK